MKNLTNMHWYTMTWYTMTMPHFCIRGFTTSIKQLIIFSIQYKNEYDVEYAMLGSWCPNEYISTSMKALLHYVHWMDFVARKYLETDLCYCIVGAAKTTQITRLVIILPRRCHFDLRPIIVIHWLLNQSVKNWPAITPVTWLVAR